MTDSRVLFCPFCRESFEGLECCPTHDLGLVAFSALPPQKLDDHVALARYSPRLGRGVLLLFALLTWLAFFLPMARLSGQENVTSSLWQMAHGQAPRLWLVPLCAWGQLLVLYRRRTPLAMRSARLVVLLLAIAPSVVVVATLRGVHAAAALMSVRYQAPVDVHIGAGAILVCLASVGMVWGGLRLGVAAAPRVQQHNRAQ